MSLKSILANITKADLDFSLIDEGDILAIGVSGGKDSMLLLKALKQYQRYPFKKFDFYAVFLDLGFGNVDINTLKEYCLSIDVKLHIEDSTEVYRILSQHKNSSGNLPCSICSRMKKAAINKVAHRLNCNKVAFAHHADDAIETLLMNTIYGGRIATFAPKMFLTDTQLTFIRPLILCREKEIISTCKKENIPIIKSSCPNDHITMREEAKKMLLKLYQNYPNSYSNYLNMLYDKKHFDIWVDKIEYPIFPHHKIKECFSSQDYALFIKTKERFNNRINTNASLPTYHSYIILHNDDCIGTISYTQNEKIFIIEELYINSQNNNLIKNIILYLESIISIENNPCTIQLNIDNNLLPIINELNYRITNQNNKLIIDKHINSAYKFKLGSLKKDA